MSNVVWSPEKGWHDGPECKVVVVDGKIATVNPDGSPITEKVIVQ